MSPPAGDPCSASPERQHVALDRSLTRASDQSTKDLQRSHLIGQQKELRAAIEAMRKDLEALPSRTAQQRLLEAERSLAELDAIYIKLSLQPGSSEPPVFAALTESEGWSSERILAPDEEIEVETELQIDRELEAAWLEEQGRREDDWVAFAHMHEEGCSCPYCQTP